MSRRQNGLFHKVSNKTEVWKYIPCCWSRVFIRIFKQNTPKLSQHSSFGGDAQPLGDPASFFPSEINWQPVGPIGHQSRSYVINHWPIGTQLGLPVNLKASRAEMYKRCILRSRFRLFAPVCSHVSLYYYQNKERGLMISILSWKFLLEA